MTQGLILKCDDARIVYPVVIGKQETRKYLRYQVPLHNINKTPCFQYLEIIKLFMILISSLFCQLGKTSMDSNW